MGTFRYPIEIGNADQSRFVRLEAWVGSGSSPSTPLRTSYTGMPSPILRELGFTPLSQRRFRMADGRIVERGICQLPIHIGQETLTTLVVLGDDESEPLLGATALEEFALGADAVHHTLVPIVSNALSFRPESEP